nr:hypothetical protein [Blastococcus sp. TML/C7B]
MPGTTSTGTRVSVPAVRNRSVPGPPGTLVQPEAAGKRSPTASSGPPSTATSSSGAPAAAVTTRTRAAPFPGAARSSVSGASERSANRPQSASVVAPPAGRSTRVESAGGAVAGEPAARTLTA